MKERPIIFTAESVRAVLNERKTQTRRVIPNDANTWARICYATDDPRFTDKALAEGHRKYGGVGDRLWVREALREVNVGWRYVADNKPVLVSKADESAAISWVHHKETDWCSSIHMPRWASRIMLEITNVRVERVQDISEADAIAEGVREMTEYNMPHNPYAPGICDDPRNAFCLLWNSINAKRGYGWDSNPWVWVIDFKRIIL